VIGVLYIAGIVWMKENASLKDYVAVGFIFVVPLLVAISQQLARLEALLQKKDKSNG